MSKQLVITTLGAILAVGTDTNPSISENLSRGYEKCYGTAQASLYDCDTSTDATSCDENTINNAWLGLPKGTCDKIVGASNIKG